MPPWEMQCFDRCSHSSSKSIENATHSSQHHHKKRRCSTRGGAKMGRPCMWEDHRTCHALLSEARSLGQSFECPHAQACCTCWTCWCTLPCHSLKHADERSCSWSLPPKFPVCFAKVCQAKSQRKRIRTVYIYIFIYLFIYLYIYIISYHIISYHINNAAGWLSVTFACVSILLSDHMT